MNTKPKALIAMSGGVDSSVTAALMMERGFDCTGVNMRLFDPAFAKAGDRIGQDTGTGSDCLTAETPGTFPDSGDVRDAARVAGRMGMPFFVIREQEAFTRCVMESFVRAYQSGITPNPCIECNRNLKFDRLLSCAAEHGCDILATGHYARVSFNEKSGRHELRKAKDPARDQSYVLYMLTQDTLAHVMFPLGDYTKAEVRGMAKEYGFANASKKDSQDICFIPDKDHARFIREYTGTEPEPGNFTDADGNVLGRHRGIIHYTIGQRKGLGISSDRPWHVKEIRADKNEIVLGRREDVTGVTLTADRFNWLSVPEPDAPLRACAKIRYRYKDAPCTVTPLPGARVRVDFDEPQPSITPGQALVLYDEDLLLGGGTIL